MDKGQLVPCIDYNTGEIYLVPESVVKPTSQPKVSIIWIKEIPLFDKGDPRNNILYILLKET